MNSLIAGLVAVIGALGGFYFGAKYGQGHPPPSSTTTTVASTTTGQSAASSTAGAGGRAGGAGGGGAALLGSAAAGQITAVSGDIITVHDRQTNKDIKVNVATARIAKTDQGTIADLTQNATVTVIGQTGADGTVSAQLITIGGGQGAFGGGRRGGASPSPGG